MPLFRGGLWFSAAAGGFCCLDGSGTFHRFHGLSGIGFSTPFSLGKRLFVVGFAKIQGDFGLGLRGRVLFPGGHRISSVFCPERPTRGG